MGLKLKLNAGEPLVVNGCRLRNNGHRRIEIEIENRADVLRGSEMFDAVTADTPVKRLCYKIQIAIVSPGHRVELRPEIQDRLGQLKGAMGAPQGEVLDEVGRLVQAGEFYTASRRLQSLITHEAKLLELAKGKPPPREVA